MLNKRKKFFWPLKVESNINSYICYKFFSRVKLSLKSWKVTKFYFAFKKIMDIMKVECLKLYTSQPLQEVLSSKGWSIVKKCFTKSMVYINSNFFSNSANSKSTPGIQDIHANIKWTHTDKTNLKLGNKILWW